MGMAVFMKTVEEAQEISGREEIAKNEAAQGDPGVVWPRGSFLQPAGQSWAGEGQNSSPVVPPAHYPASLRTLAPCV